MLEIRRKQGSPDSGQQRATLFIANLTPYIATVMKIDAATALWSRGLDSIPMTEWWFLCSQRQYTPASTHRMAYREKRTEDREDHDCEA